MVVERVSEAPGASRLRLRRQKASRKTKISVTVDEVLWNEVQAFVAGGHGAESASAAVEYGLFLWVANQRLATALDAAYTEDPAIRPTDAEVEHAAEVLGL
ncbi:MAG: hypothetical protein ACRDZO_23065 [Egibacteraceae bacterium]